MPHRAKKIKQDIQFMRSQLNFLATKVPSLNDPLFVHYSQLLDIKINAYYRLLNERKQMLQKII